MVDNWAQTTGGSTVHHSQQGTSTGPRRLLAGLIALALAAAAGARPAAVGAGEPGAGRAHPAATTVKLHGPAAVAADAAGHLYMADDQDRSVYRVTPRGELVPVASGFLSPAGLAADGAGNVYVADRNAQQVLKVAADGQVSPVAGTRRSGFSGDGGPATAAQLRDPTALALDARGNLYIADTGNHRIRRVAPDGTVTTVAGSGTPGFSGDGGPATAAALLRPEGVTVDATGNLFIADTGNQRIRKVTLSGRISTVAGSGQYGYGGDGGPATGARLYQPAGLAAGADGSVYVADQSNHRIRRLGPDGQMTTVAGTGDPGFGGDGGPALQAEVSGATGLAAGPDGSLYVADTNNHRIRRVAPDGVVSTLAGDASPGFRGDGGPAAMARLRYPRAVALDASGNLYVADTGNQRIRRIAPDGTITTVAGSGEAGLAGDGGPATGARLQDPQAVAAGADGRVYIADTGNHRIREVLPGGAIRTLGVSGLRSPGALALDAAGLALAGDGTLLIADTGNHRVRAVAPDGTIRTVAGSGSRDFPLDHLPATAADLAEPTGVAVDPNGTLYVSQPYFSVIRQVGADGRIRPFTRRVTTGRGLYPCDARTLPVQGVAALAADARGNVYVAEREAGRVLRVAPDGTVFPVAGGGVPGYGGDGGPAVSAQLREPSGLAADAAGNLYIADAGNRRVRRVAPDGGIDTVAALPRPEGIAVDASGHVYVSDRETHRIHRIAPDGQFTALAGTGTAGFSGDGGPAAAAQLREPGALAPDGRGGLYVADQGNRRVRRIDPDGTIATVAVLDRPGGLALDAAGHLYVTAAHAHKVYRVGPDGR